MKVTRFQTSLRSPAHGSESTMHLSHIVSLALKQVPVGCLHQRMIQRTPMIKADWRTNNLTLFSQNVCDLLTGCIKCDKHSTCVQHNTSRSRNHACKALGDSFLKPKRCIVGLWVGSHIHSVPLRMSNQTHSLSPSLTAEPPYSGNSTESPSFTLVGITSPSFVLSPGPTATTRASLICTDSVGGLHV